MKKQFAFIGAIVMLVASSCKKDIPGYINEDGSFDASLPVSNIAAGDTAYFNLFDNPDVISFYSGEVGHEYANKDRTVLEGGSLIMKFESRVTVSTPDTLLDVMISNDFNGNYDSANVANANWKRMTNKFVFPDTTATLGVFYPSGATSADFVNLTDSVTTGHPFYLAFKYNNVAPTGILWSINKLAMYNTFASGGVANATVIDSNQISSGNFTSVQFGDNIPRWTTSSTYLKCTNSTTAPTPSTYWYISRPLNPSAVNPDLPISIKNISQNPLTSFNYKYSTPGTYKATFVAAYKRLNYEKTIVKEFTIVVQ